MAATENNHGPATILTEIDADWVADSVMTVEKIVFVPGLANDVCIIRGGAVDGSKIAHFKPTDVEPRVEYFHGARIKPAIELDDCTLNTGHSVIIWERE